MNVIKQLYDEQFVLKYFKKKVLPQYPDFESIKQINIHGIKNFIWEKTYHVVVAYETFFINKNGEEERLEFFCSAHSSEQRKNVYDALKFLWSKGFNKGNLTIPRPLFYSQRFKGIFYQGITGNNVYHYIRNQEIKEVKSLIKLSAQWLAKLHDLNTEGARNFNKKNSLMETTVPGSKHWLNSIQERQTKYYKIVKQIFDILNKEEKTFLRSTKQRWLTHGDAHPENVIKITDEKIGVIDFTDLCLADFARDLGSFLQQIEYMSIRHWKNVKDIESVKKLFLTEYAKTRNIDLDKNLRQRIQSYYNWTALRTVIFFLIKEHPEPERAEELINQIKDNLNLK